MFEEETIVTLKNSFVVSSVLLVFIGLVESVEAFAESVFDVGVGVLSLLDFVVLASSYGLIAFILSMLVFLAVMVVSKVFIQ